jgi:hypothetical protein
MVALEKEFSPRSLSKAFCAISSPVNDSMADPGNGFIMHPIKKIISSVVSLSFI